ncbi:MAG: Na+/H+ antiporter NhaC family protein, partial [Selenomonadaceae bacterium]|nr:Na+/H+ antiporter NhaC family protein [Selenomonadaceae bacterium]
HATLVMFLPVIFFVVSIGLAFATGTSWGTFGILIPIAMSVLVSLPTEQAANLLVICIAAILAGSVGGDHASPISDTTILASAGAQCHHIDHVSTQVPYVLTVSSCCVVGYTVSGITESGWLGLGVALACLALVMTVIRAKVPPVEV